MENKDISSLESHVDLFKIGGVHKNMQEDCWEFVKLKYTANSQIQSEVITERISVSHAINEVKIQTHIHGHNSISVAQEMEEDGIDEKEGKKKRIRKKKHTKTINSKKDLHIRWGQVQQFIFNRNFGNDAVPSHGLYPLGLGDYEETCSFTVDELFAKKQLKAFLSIQEVEEPSAKLNLTKKQSSSSQPTRSSPRIRKDSFDLPESAVKDEKTKAIKSNEKINAMRPKLEHERIELLKEFVDVSNKDYGEILHKELEQLRDSRDCVGCSCKPLKVDKLNVGKLKSELLHRKHLIKDCVDVEKMKKTELITYLKEALKECPTCIAENCDCVKMGIACAGNACDCVFRPGESESCSNPYGSFTFDPDKVNAYRQHILEGMKLNSSV